MKVYIKNDVLSIGGSSEVLDEQQQPVFTVEGTAFSIRRKKNLLDKDGKLLYIIRNRFFNVFSYKTNIYDANKEKLATVSIARGWVKEKYKITGMDDEMEIVGSFFSRECSIQRNGQEIGKMKRESSFIADSFSLEADEKELPFLIALVVAFDNINDKRSRKK